MKQKNVNNQVYNTIRSEILLMDILPGEVLSETEIAKRFDVSRTPVREAFQRLELEGLLEIKSHQGTFVTLIDLNTISDIRFMREQSELEIFRILMATSSATLDIKLRIILENQKALFTNDLSDRELAKEFIKSDNEFHRTLFEHANKLGVWEYLQSIEHHYERLRVFLNVHDIEYLRSLYEDHIFFHQQILAKNWDEVEERYRKHLSRGIERGAELIISNAQYFEGL